MTEVFHNHDHEHEEYKADGIDNGEHVLDIFDEIKLMRENITDNTDLAFNLLKSIKEEGDTDIVDSLTIFCSDILEQEKQSKEVFDRAEALIENSRLVKEREKLAKIEDMMKEYFVAIKLSEENSQHLVEKVIKIFK